MPTYNITEMSRILDEESIFIPAEAVLFTLIKEGKTEEIKGGLSPLSERRYRITKDDVLLYGRSISKKGYFLCESNELSINIRLPKIEDIFERFIEMSKTEIILLAPYLSTEFIADLGEKFVYKKSIIKIITNAPKSSISLPRQAEIINSLKKKGIDVTTSRVDLHAKVYIFDRKAAILCSSNLSRRGFFSLYELGTVIFGEDVMVLRDLVDNLIGDNH